jgi:hypothetical protein
VTNFLKWLFLSIVGGTVSTLTFLLLGKVKALNDLKEDLHDARLIIELDKAKVNFTKKKEAYEAAVNKYRELVLTAANVTIIPVVSDGSGEEPDESADDLQRGDRPLQ